jgi:hypothetical protein
MAPKPCDQPGLRPAPVSSCPPSATLCGGGSSSALGADAAAVIRVLVTGSRQSPNLEEVAAVLGRDEVLRHIWLLA